MPKHDGSRMKIVIPSDQIIYVVMSAGKVVAVTLTWKRAKEFAAFEEGEALIVPQVLRA